MKDIFKNLIVRTGISMKRVNIDVIVSMFEYNEMRLAQLDYLNENAGGIGLKDKKYRHVCYMFALTY